MSALCPGIYLQFFWTLSLTNTTTIIVVIMSIFFFTISSYMLTTSLQVLFITRGAPSHQWANYLLIVLKSLRFNLPQGEPLFCCYSTIYALKALQKFISLPIFNQKLRFFFSSVQKENLNFSVFSEYFICYEHSGDGSCQERSSSHGLSSFFLSSFKAEATEL